MDNTGKAVIIIAGLSLVGAETAHMLHRQIDGPKQAHTEHQHHPAPEKSTITIVASGAGNVRVTPGSGSLSIKGQRAVVGLSIFLAPKLV